MLCAVESVNFEAPLVTELSAETDSHARHWSQVGYRGQLMLFLPIFKFYY